MNQTSSQGHAEAIDMTLSTHPRVLCIWAPARSRPGALPHEGAVRARHLEQQTEQAWCLTVVTNPVITWTTEYYGLDIDSMRAAGRRIDDEVLAHISPAHSENINFFGHRRRHRRRTRPARPHRAAWLLPDPRS
ncbi:hypothetical protein GCM10011608_55800 [Micromonospora sonchi]|uniref:Tn3 transposase DDE domain-containing protein n=1 Tax=Micromonospora sonchi TaxID=1763543 RepID=A0A917X438_9ACTN|nr:transposase [Micromonospora sonchi]GGM63408.1 hypothetical protein GCM10011608_55800 [Micromonospora sonchi]